MPFFQSKRICILTAAVAAILLAMIASADVPQTINYQGRLTDSSGSPLDTIVDMTFTLTSGMSLPWTETHSDVVVTDGLFTVLLGSITPFHASLFESTGLSLGIEVGDGPMSDPLIPLASVPYALNAEHSDTADYAHTSPGSSANGWVDDGAVVRLESAVSSSWRISSSNF